MFLFQSWSNAWLVYCWLLPRIYCSAKRFEQLLCWINGLLNNVEVCLWVGRIERIWKYGYKWLLLRGWLQIDNYASRQKCPFLEENYGSVQDFHALKKSWFFINFHVLKKITVLYKNAHVLKEIMVLYKILVHHGSL